MQRMTCNIQQNTIMETKLKSTRTDNESFYTFMNAMQQQKCQKLSTGKVILIQRREFLAISSIQKLDYNK